MIGLSHGEAENQSGRASMQTAAKISLVLTDSSSFEQLAGLQKVIRHAGFYQQIISGLVKGIHTKRLWAIWARDSYCWPNTLMRSAKWRLWSWRANFL